MTSSAPSNRPALLSRPYSDRQLIVVTDDIAADIVVEAMHEPDPENALSVALSRATVVAAIVSQLLTPPDPVETIRDIISTLWRARESGIPIIEVGKSEAAQLHFPPGHPREKVLYVGHPAMPRVYHTIAEFHRVTFEHKFSEAINLLMHLGANHIRVEHVRGWSKEFSGRLSVGLGALGTTAEGEVVAGRRAASSLLFEATLSGTMQPSLPESLVWYPHEPTWQSIAKGRLNFGLQDFSMSVTYDDDYGVHAGLKASTQKAGLELGGKFEDHQETAWRIAGQFRADC